MMSRRLSFVALLISVSLSSSGCLNGVISLIVHPDGSVTYIEDMVLDKMLLDITAMAKDTTHIAFGEKKKSVVWDKAHADAVRDILFAEQLKTRSSKSYVRSVVAIDTPTYSGLHFIVTTELTSYRYLDSIIRVKSDTSKSTVRKKRHSKSHTGLADAAKLPTSEPLISESGDSIKITVPSSFPKLDDLMKNFPDRRAPMFNKTSLPIKRHSLISETLYRPNASNAEGDDDSTGGSGSMMDSLGKMMGMFTGMMSDMFSLDYNIQVPGMLSRDSSAEFDPSTNTLHWHIDLSTMFTGGSASTEQRYVWFRKPGQ